MSAVASKTAGRRAPRVLEATAEHRQSGLAAALLAFHAEAPKLTRDATGQIGSRTYTYTSLDALLDDVEPLLLKQELLWTAKVILEDGSPAALYRMEHVLSGEFEEWTGPLPCADPGPQALGSAITYMRRYTLQAYLNLAPGDDDDGVAASPFTGRPPVDRYAQPPDIPPLDDPAHDPVSRTQPQAAPRKPSERQLNEAQRKMLETRARAAGLSAVAFANVVMVAKGDQPRDSDDQDAAARWLGRELDRLPARLVTTVKKGIDAASNGVGS